MKKDSMMLDPQQCVEIEEAVLGAAMLERDAMYSIVDILKPESFYNEKHATVYDAILRMHKEGKTVDVLTVVQRIKAMNKLESIGGAYFVSSLTNRIASSANVEYHARIIQQNFLLRELTRESIYITKKTFEPDVDVFDLQEEALARIQNITNGIATSAIQTIGQAKDSVINECLISMESDKILGVETGLKALTEHTGGWQKSKLIIIAARPGMGKTSAALLFAMSAAKAGHPVGFISLEMTADELASKAMSCETDFPNKKIYERNMSHAEVDQVNFGSKTLNDLPLYIDDTPEMTINKLKSIARKLKREQKIELLVVDYLQLMKGEDRRSNREGEISEISRGLKVLSRELKIPIIALSQLSRKVDERPGQEKEPILSDLRESGAIEQDADMVIFCYRPQYYREEGDYSIGKNTYDIKGLFVFIIAKFRGGSLGKIKARWIGYLTKIVNYDNETPKTAEVPADDLPF